MSNWLLLDLAFPPFPPPPPFTPAGVKGGALDLGLPRRTPEELG